MKREIKLTGVAKAAAATGVSRWHVYLCIRGERTPSKKVRDAIRKHVVVYVPVRLDDQTMRNGPTKNH